MTGEGTSNMQLDKTALEAYRNRWRMVAAVERAEQKESSLLQRWLKLNALLRLAVALELPSMRDDERNDIVHRRWNQIRKAYRRSVQGTRSEVF